ncbi:MAG TPA: hypothetical protein VI136_24280, partial [Verrucomicrobiae bacterium]
KLSESSLAGAPAGDQLAAVLQRPPDWPVHVLVAAVAHKQEASSMAALQKQPHVARAVREAKGRWFASDSACEEALLMGNSGVCILAKS